MHVSGLADDTGRTIQPTTSSLRGDCADLCTTATPSPTTSIPNPVHLSRLSKSTIIPGHLNPALDWLHIHNSAACGTSWKPRQSLHSLPAIHINKDNNCSLRKKSILFRCSGALRYPDWGYRRSQHLLNWETEGNNRSMNPGFLFQSSF